MSPPAIVYLLTLCVFDNTPAPNDFAVPSVKIAGSCHGEAGPVNKWIVGRVPGFIFREVQSGGTAYVVEFWNVDTSLTGSVGKGKGE